MVLRNSNAISELNIFLTNRCNLDCSYCFVKKKEQKEINGARPFDKIISYFINSPGQSKAINFTGGEPLLDFKKLREIIVFAKKVNKQNKKLNITVVTNATLLKAESVNFFKENQIDLKISIDGKKVFHDSNRCYKSTPLASSYDKIINKLSLFSRYGLQARATMVFTPSNYKQLINNISHLKNLGFAQIDFSPDLYAFWREKDRAALEEVFAGFSVYYSDLFLSGSGVFKNSFLSRMLHNKNQSNKPICNKIHLDCNGNMYYCDKVFSLTEGKRAKFLVGKLSSGMDLKLRLKLLQAKQRDANRAIGLSCQKCNYRQYCYCLIGQYIYFEENGLDCGKYLKQTCFITKLYARNFLKIIDKLKTNKLFKQVYNI